MQDSDKTVEDMIETKKEDFLESILIKLDARDAKQFIDYFGKSLTEVSAASRREVLEEAITLSLGIRTASDADDFREQLEELQKES